MEYLSEYLLLCLCECGRAKRNERRITELCTVQEYLIIFKREEEEEEKSKKRSEMRKNNYLFKQCFSNYNLFSCL